MSLNKVTRSDPPPPLLAPQMEAGKAEKAPSYEREVPLLPNGGALVSPADSGDIPQPTDPDKPSKKDDLPLYAAWVYKETRKYEKIFELRDRLLPYANIDPKARKLLKEIEKSDEKFKILKIEEENT